MRKTPALLTTSAAGVFLHPFSLELAWPTSVF